MNGFSLSRWLGILIKEFIQLKRDRLTFGMIIGVPILQLLLFGFAINSDPRHLPTAVVMADPGPFARAYVAAMANSDYFKIVGSVDEREAGRLLDQGAVQFVVTFPPGFHRDLVRGKPPTLLVEADATDPMAAAVAAKENSVLRADEKMPLEDPAEMLLHSMARTEYLNEGSRLAALIVKRMDTATSLKSRGVKQAGFFVLRGTYAPSVLVEMGFMSNAEDCRYLNNSKALGAIAKGIYQGIVDYAKAQGWR